MYSIEELEKIEGWLNKKLSTMGQPLQKSDDYNEANLTKAILGFIKYMIMVEKHKYNYTNPPLPNIPNISSVPSIYTYTNTTGADLVCPQCRAINPTLSCCIHRVSLNSSDTTGE